jgi:hypothetical protein
MNENGKKPAVVLPHQYQSLREARQTDTPVSRVRHQAARSVLPVGANGAYEIGVTHVP